MSPCARPSSRGPGAGGGPVDNPDRGRVLGGIGYILLSVIFFTVMDATAKYLATRYHPAAITWIRYISNLVLMLLLLRQWPGTLLRTAHPRAQVLRGVIILACTLLYFTALGFIPLADAAAIAATAPIFVTALSVPLLGERVGPRRWTAIAIGFLGALIIIRPGFGEAHWAVALPLIMALFYAYYAIITRRIGATENPEGMLFYVALVGTIASSFVGPFFWTTPEPLDFALMVLVGAMAGLGHYAIIQSLRRAPASVVSPFHYLQIATAALSGWLLFDHLPDRWTLVGAGFIGASGLYVIYREAQLARQGRSQLR
ncbi:MAG: DMT family transporter [Alphaproteobacteria bacterium]|nr:DMT family transporter [Alphaproteobacteria bacterium]